MSDNKKYYYLKLKENFFDREEIKVIKGMDKGDTYVCIMLELYLRSLKRDGLLMMTDRIPYNLKTLSSVLGRPQDEIKFAIDLFNEFKLVDTLNTGEMYMSDIQNFIGQSSSEGDRKREYRKSIEQKQLGQMSDNRPPELELETELETELDIDKGNPLSIPIPQVDIDKSFIVESKKTDTPVVAPTQKSSSKIAEDVFLKSVEKVFDKWLGSPKTTKHKKLDKDTKKAISKKLEEYTLVEISTSIENYSSAYADDEGYFNHKWTLYEFMTRKNAMPVFLHKTKNDYKKSSSNNFKTGSTAKPNSLADPRLEMNQSRDFGY